METFSLAVLTDFQKLHDPTACLLLHLVHFWDLNFLIAINCKDHWPFMALVLAANRILKYVLLNVHFSLLKISVIQFLVKQFLPFRKKKKIRVHSNSHLLSDLVLSKHILLYLNSEIWFHVTSFVKHYLWPRKAWVVHGGLLIWLDQPLRFNFGGRVTVWGWRSRKWPEDY